MDLLGVVVRLQVQVQSLKIGERPNRHYDPTGIVAVPRLTIGVDGVTGWTWDGEPVPDVHNAKNPANKNRGDNGVSIGFTNHYAAMRQRFGPHLRDGLAGENVLVSTGMAGGARYTEGELGSPIVIEASGGHVKLVEAHPAEPCVEFSRYSLSRAEARDNEVQEALRFLRQGMRGYYATWAGGDAAIEVGDLVYLA